jgi:hypothetical protein
LKSQLVLKLGAFSRPIIPLLAGNLARAAANALGDVDQCGLDGRLGRLRHV